MKLRDAAWELLRRAHEESEKDPTLSRVNFIELGERMGLDFERTWRVTQLLEHRGLIECIRTFGHCVGSVTAEGVLVAEQEDEGASDCSLSVSSVPPPPETTTSTAERTPNRQQQGRTDAFTADMRERLRKERVAANHEIANWFVKFAQQGLTLEGSSFDALWSLPVSRLDRVLDEVIEQTLRDCQAEKCDAKLRLAKLEPLLMDYVEQVWLLIADRAYRKTNQRKDPRTPQTTSTIERWKSTVRERITLAEEGRVGGKYVYRHPGAIRRSGSWLATHATAVVVGIIITVGSALLLGWLLNQLGP